MSISKSIEANYKYWLGCAIKVTKSHEEAIDLLHEVVVRLYDSPAFAKLADKPDARPYVCAAIAIQYKSRNGSYHKNFREFSERSTEITNTNITQDEWLGARLDNEQLDVLISRLPEFDRDLFEVHLLGGWSYDATAEATGIPKKYIIRNINYSIEKIRNVVSKNRNSGRPS